MTESRKTQLEVGVDPTQAKQGLGEIKREAQSMAQTVAQAGNQASKAVDGIGAGGSASAAKVDTATKSMIQSIQRATAVMEAGSRTSARYYEVLANQRGVDVTVLRPYLSQLEAVAAKQKAAEQAIRGSDSGLKGLGMTAGQTANALRMVPAQLTDIVTSLASGQAPLTVLIQQGGQLKDMFGGIGPAARALGGYVAGLINPLTLAAGAVGVLGVAYLAGKKEGDAFNRALIMSGNIAGTTASQLQDMAAGIDSVYGTQRAAVAALAQMAGGGKVASRNLEEFTAVALRMEDAVGISVDETVKNFQELGKAPTEASRKLNEQYRYLTAAVFEQISALEEQGRQEEAAAVAQNAFAVEFDKRTKAVVDNLGLLERGWKSVKKGASEAIDEMLRIGRATTLSDQLKDVQSQIGSYNPFSIFGDDIDTLKARRDSIIETMRLEERAAASAGERAALQQAAVAAIDAVNKANEKALSKQDQMNKALDVYRANIDKIRAANPTSALLDPKLIASAEKAIRDSFADKGAISKFNAELEKQARLLAEGAGLTGEFAGDWERLSKAYAAGEISLSDLVERQAKLLAQQPAIKKNIEAEARAVEVLAAEWEEAARARESEMDRSYRATLASIKLVNDYGRGIDENNKLTEYEISLLGKTESQREIAVEQYRIQLDLQREKLKLDELGLDAEEKRVRLAQLDAAAARAMDGAAQRAWLNDWKRINDDIGRSLSDALMQGGQSAGDYLKNYFKTLVFRPIIQAVMAPVSGAIASAFAPSTAATATSAGGAGGALSWLSAGKFLWDGFSTGFGAMGNTASQVAQYGFGLGGTAPVSTGMAGTGWVSAEGGAAYLGSGASALGTAASWAGGIGAGLGLGQLLSGQYSLIGKNSMAATGLGTAAGGIAGSLGLLGSVGGPLGALIGGAVGGLLNRAFGRGPKEVKAFGIEGDFDSDSFAGRNFADWKQKGGWFRSDKKGTNFSPLDTAIADQFSASMVAIRDQTTEFAEALGLSADAIDGYSKHIRLTLTKDEAENQKLIAEMFGVIGDEMAGIVGDFSAFAKEGEAASVTLQRLAVSLTTANGWLDRLQQTLFQSSIAGGDAASKLADAFGGLENLAAVSAAFYQAYYTEGERAARSREDMRKALESVDLVLPETMAELRNMADGLDLTTEAGRKAYVTLLSIAPEFANVAQATERLAKETAGNLLAAFSGRGALTMALTGTSMLAEEIYRLGQNAADAVIDFAGLAEALADVDTATFTEAIAQAFERLAGRISDVIGAIADERAAVREAALQITNPAGMTPDQIRAAITGINTTMPGSMGIAGLDAKYALVEQRAAAQAAALAPYQAARDALAAFRSTAVPSTLEGAQLVQMNGKVPTANAELYANNSAYREAWDTLLASHYQKYGKGYDKKSDAAQIEQGLQALLAPVIAAEKAAFEKSVQQQVAAVATLEENYKAATAALAEAQTDAADHARAAQVAYADALQQFALDAGQSVNKLSRLREETLRYYEAQKRLADLMTASAAGLRKTVSDFRYSQMAPEDQFAALRTQFATAYSMSQATQGEALAGYADKLNGLVNPLLEKALEVYGDGADYNAIVAAVLAQANNVAGRLDNLTPTDYAADSLEMLEQIDATLASLEAAAKSADQLIVGAINAGRDQTVNGLRAVVAALTGQSIPAFANGGDHAGGIALVGERGRELINTGPARVFTAAQTKQILSGGGGNAELLAEVRRLNRRIEELQMATEAVASHTSNTARRLERIEQDGMVVRTEDDMPLKTTEAA
ncbi:MAG TPA: phage tail length tape measure family protein [Noviherbaspirillum sp.]|jgi:phage-related minor tail protein|uniref:phage tail length tape measure family protein n=1 Tax=Noviherbaspirillum sp. TaxID=1926288 RepID=UPI002F928797